MAGPRRACPCYASDTAAMATTPAFDGRRRKRDKRANHCAEHRGGRHASAARVVDSQDCSDRRDEHRRPDGHRDHRDRQRAPLGERRQHRRGSSPDRRGDQHLCAEHRRQHVIHRLRERRHPDRCWQRRGSPCVQVGVSQRRRDRQPDPAAEPERGAAPGTRGTSGDRRPAAGETEHAECGRASRRAASSTDCVPSARPGRARRRARSTRHRADPGRSALPRRRASARPSRAGGARRRRRAAITAAPAGASADGASACETSHATRIAVATAASARAGQAIGACGSAGAGRSSTTVRGGCLGASAGG